MSPSNPVRFIAIPPDPPARVGADGKRVVWTHSTDLRWTRCDRHRVGGRGVAAADALRALGVDEDTSDPAVIRALGTTPWRADEHPAMSRPNPAASSPAVSKSASAALTLPLTRGNPEPFAYLDRKPIVKAIEVERDRRRRAAVPRRCADTPCCVACGVIEAFGWTDHDRVECGHRVVLCGPCSTDYVASGADETRGETTLGSFRNRLACRALRLTRPYPRSPDGRFVVPLGQTAVFGVAERYSFRLWWETPGAVPSDEPFGYIEAGTLEAARADAWRVWPRRAPSEVQARARRRREVEARMHRTAPVGPQAPLVVPRLGGRDE